MIKNKNLIINDPIYGFIPVDNTLIYTILQHSFFQRLRRINQLSVSDLTYPGAVHTRFHHSIGAYYLITLALQKLKSKGVNINDDEFEATQIAILLHDIGHGPFSHTLEGTIIKNVSHEEISLAIMNFLNKEFDGRLSLAIQIFDKKYHRKFFHQLISSQLDVDRLDYLTRDSFYTGVAEGVIGYDRIIHMMNVFNDELVIEEKGMYSIEEFLISRRIMYWQVYHHKTVWATEKLMKNIFHRIQELPLNQKDFLRDTSLYFFLTEHFDIKKIDHLKRFNQLDDIDMLHIIKIGMNHQDKILQLLCNAYINRTLYKVQISNTPEENNLESVKKNILQYLQHLQIEEKYLKYFVIEDKISQIIYDNKKEKIKVLFKGNVVKDISEIDSILIKAAANTNQSKYYKGFWRI